MEKKEEKIQTDIAVFVKEIINGLGKSYWKNLYDYLEKKPELKKTFPGFLLNFEKLIVYIGRTHIGIEYIGPEILKNLKPMGAFQCEYFDYSTSENNLLDKIIGFDFSSSSSSFSLPLSGVMEDLIVPTLKGHDKLSELNWNFAAQNFVMGINVLCPLPVPGHFARIINGFFFDADKSGLKTRHIKWLDFIPIEFDGSDEEIDTFSIIFDPIEELVERDAHYQYPIPKDFKFSKLPKINRFIELWGNNKTKEPEITAYLAQPENNFIITMRFGAKDLEPEKLCKWQSEEKNDIKPDFFLIKPDGYADILEFKLPNIKARTTVGPANREHFSAWLNEYIAQTRVYSTYFDDPNNRKWVEQKHGIKVYKPKRWLVVGRRSDFKAEIWKEILADYSEVEILSFDDLIDGVVSQFYK